MVKNTRQASSSVKNHAKQSPKKALHILRISLEFIPIGSKQEMLGKKVIDMYELEKVQRQSSHFRDRMKAN